MPSVTAHALATWARGIPTEEAAVLILIEALNGRFAEPHWPWIVPARDGHYYIDAEQLTDDNIGALSGGEQRILSICRSLLGGQPVHLHDALPGLDQAHGHLIIDALAHATGVIR